MVRTTRWQAGVGLCILGLVETDKIITMLRRKSLTLNIAVEAECVTCSIQVIDEKQGSYNFMGWVCDWVKLHKQMINNNSNE